MELDGDQGWLLSLPPGLRVFIQVYILQVRPPGLSLNRQVTSLLLLKGFLSMWQHSPREERECCDRRWEPFLGTWGLIWPSFYLSGERQQHRKLKAVEHLLSPSHISEALYSASTVLFRLPSSPQGLVLLLLQLDSKVICSKSYNL